MKKTITITIRNDFHNTSCVVRLTAVPGGWYMSPHQRRRSRQALCIKECICAGAMGERGEQDWRISSQGETYEGGLIIVFREDLEPEIEFLPLAEPEEN